MKSDGRWGGNTLQGRKLSKCSWYYFHLTSGILRYRWEWVGSGGWGYHEREVVFFLVRKGANMYLGLTCSSQNRADQQILG